MEETSTSTRTDATHGGEQVEGVPAAATSVFAQRTPELKAAGTLDFLAALGGSRGARFTFVARHEAPCEVGGPLRRFFHGSFSRCANELIKLNDAGYGIFVLANEGDGKGTGAKNIRHLRALFVDLDHGLPSGGFPMTPTFVVETSPGRFQAWFMLDEEVPEHRWRALHDRIVKALGGDPAAGGTSRLLRVPGFLHNKRAPVLARLDRELSNSAMRYSVAELEAAFLPVPAPAPVKRSVADQRAPRWDGTPEGERAVLAALDAIARRLAAEGSFVVTYENGNTFVVDLSTRETWELLLRALNSFYRGHPDHGEKIARAFSKGDPARGWPGGAGFDEGDQAKVFNSYLERPHKLVTARTIFAWARACGWRQRGRPWGEPRERVQSTSAAEVIAKAVPMPDLDRDMLIESMTTKAGRPGATARRIIEDIVANIDPATGVAELPESWARAVAQERGVSTDAIGKGLDQLDSRGVIWRSKGTGIAISVKGWAVVPCLDQGDLKAVCRSRINGAGRETSTRFDDASRETFPTSLLPPSPSDAAVDGGATAAALGGRVGVSWLPVGVDRSVLEGWHDVLPRHVVVLMGRWVAEFDRQREEWKSTRLVTRGARKGQVVDVAPLATAPFDPIVRGLGRLAATCCGLDQFQVAVDHAVERLVDDERYRLFLGRDAVLGIDVVSAATACARLMLQLDREAEAIKRKCRRIAGRPARPAQQPVEPYRRRKEWGSEATKNLAASDLDRQEQRLRAQERDDDGCDGDALIETASERPSGARLTAGARAYAEMSRGGVDDLVEEPDAGPATMASDPDRDPTSAPSQAASLPVEEAASDGDVELPDGDVVVWTDLQPWQRALLARFKASPLPLDLGHDAPPVADDGGPSLEADPNYLAAVDHDADLVRFAEAA